MCRFRIVDLISCFAVFKSWQIPQFSWSVVLSHAAFCGNCSYVGQVVSCIESYFFDCFLFRTHCHHATILLAVRLPRVIRNNPTHLSWDLFHDLPLTSGLHPRTPAQCQDCLALRISSFCIVIRYKRS